MIETNGKIYLKQEKEVLPYINMEIVMKYINKLHNTRRVARNWNLISEEEKNKMDIHPKYFGIHSIFYYKNDYPETIPNINDRGENHSLIMPFYIEKENNNYVLKCLKNPKGNDTNSISQWFYFLHENIFYQLGIETKGEFKYIDNETGKRYIIKTAEKVILYKNTNMKYYEQIVEMKDFKEYMKRKNSIDIFFPKFMEEISKKIQAKKLQENYSFEP
jgi:hypothetical protein